MAGLLKEITDLPSVTEVTAGLGDFLLIKQGDTDRRIRIRDIFKFHTGNTINPHSVTKTQVGLDKVNNWEETVDYTYPSDDKYANIGAVRSLASEVDTVEASITDHSNDISNPHNVSNSQVGLSALHNWEDTIDYTYSGDDKYANIGAVRRLSEDVNTRVSNSIPTGIISMWSGSIVNIPNGYALCDGANGTPDLRDKFLVGAGGAYSVGSRGGSLSSVHSHTGVIGSTSLTIAQIPSHNHLMPTWDDANNYTPSHTSNGGYGTYRQNPTTYTGGGEGHTHTSYIGGSSTNNLPPYYALCFIMKL